MGKISSTVLTWLPFQKFKELYVFNGLLLLKTDHSNRGLVINCTTKWQPLNNFYVLLINEVTQRNFLLFYKTTKPFHTLIFGN